MLMEFYSKLAEEFKGSLVRTCAVKEFNKNAKEYLHKLSRKGLVERVAWGWYFVKDNMIDVWDFLSRDKTFKIIVGQTAASLWNNDFVHRDVYTILVKDKSYARALENFSEKYGFKIEVSYSDNLPRYVKMGNLYVEDFTESIIDCLNRWAFLDAMAIIYEQREKINVGKFVRRYYWKRLAGSDIRIGQVLGYGFKKFNEETKRKIFPGYRISLKDKFVRRTIDEAIEKVVELG